MTDPITVGVDGSGRSLRALVRAAHEVKPRRCPLRIVHVLPPLHSHATTGEGHAWEASDWDESVTTEATAIVRETHPDLEVTSALPAGAPAAVSPAEAEHAHTIVLGAQGMGGFGRPFLGSVASRVVGHAACPRSRT
ncbi:hypothetical protein Shyhy01_69180 [Streptomyces hygroscopicus subsp. hygroscopicus]|nr:universal stress protein [Streptomyces hygroscopicus]GLX53969.1 hypothetical protein Shyhy01_69180 [Streptomyces hygroscopicus subsp. hygroscopicus]